jgi:hypothetical protein
VEFGATRAIGRANVDAAIRGLIESEQIDRVKLGRETEFFAVEMD